MAIGIGEFISGIFKPVTSVVNKYQERKQAEETGKQKIKKAMLDNENSLDLSEAEWERVAVGTNATTWKDEYVTVLVTAPLLMIFLGALFSPFDFGVTLSASGLEAISALNGLEGTYATILQMVIFAAIGINAKRKLFK